MSEYLLSRQDLPLLKLAIARVFFPPGSCSWTLLGSGENQVHPRYFDSYFSLGGSGTAGILTYDPSPVIARVQFIVLHQTEIERILVCAGGLVGPSLSWDQGMEEARLGSLEPILPGLVVWEWDQSTFSASPGVGWGGGRTIK